MVAEWHEIQAELGAEAEEQGLQLTLQQEQADLRIRVGVVVLRGFLEGLHAPRDIDHEDEFHRIDRAGILPRPKRQIPIWLGGSSEVAYERAARIADGFLFSGRTQTQAVEIKARIEAQLAELGRADDNFGFESIQQFSQGANKWPHDIAAWRDAGGSHISVVTMGAGFETVDQHIDAIRQWRAVYDAG